MGAGGDELPQAVIVAGPTASGKSALALGLAQRLGGVVINADAMQCYRELRIVTARPSEAETALVPHALYGVWPAAEAGAAAWWRAEALAAMAAARAAGRVPILCGGTGMYFGALVHGLAEIPECGEAARAEARWMLAELGPQGLYAALMKVDQATAARLRPSDSQRVARAWEVWRGTGRGMAAWQAEPTQGAPWRFTAFVVDPPREALRAAIAARLQRMVAAGVVEEVQQFLRLGLDPALPAMRALGVPELAAYLAGDCDLAAALQRIALVSGQYTKRQATWFRHRRMADASRTHTITSRIAEFTQFSESESAEILAFIESGG